MSDAHYDLVIRGGQVFDGSGDAPFAADVAVSGGRIAAIGTVTGRGREEIDARGRIVTPGFVDVHTHYDGQVTWANRLSPSSDHGVTTVVMGNCGVGFAPCRPADRDHLVRLMEGVEDIPGAVMTEGLPWTWETYPQYLDFLGSRQFDMDVASYLPHAPLRVYAMGQRGLDREPATAPDMARMRDLAREAVAAGALGVSTSRTLNHRSSDLRLLPGISAAEGELVAIGEGVQAGGGGLLQFVSDFSAPEMDFAMLRRVAETTGLPMTFTVLQVNDAPDRWRTVLDLAGQANSEGVSMRPQVISRPVGVILGLQMKYNVFSFSPSYKAIAHLPLDERLARMRDPEVRQRIIAEYPTQTLEVLSSALGRLANVYPWGDTPNYEPGPGDSIAALAEARGINAAELAYDLQMAHDGRDMFMAPALNFSEGNFAAIETMINHRDALIGLGDGGAHVGIICDASGQTFLLKRWVGDGSGGTMSLEKAIHALSWRNAQAMGLLDRGLLKPGYRADINVIDIDHLTLHRPEMVYDLPLGSGRLKQKADGYVATLVGGAVTYRDGTPTGALPGRLVRGRQPAPADA